MRCYLTLLYCNCLASAAAPEMYRKGRVVSTVDDSPPGLELWGLHTVRAD